MTFFFSHSSYCIFGICTLETALCASSDFSFVGVFISSIVVCTQHHSTSSLASVWFWRQPTMEQLCLQSRSQHSEWNTASRCSVICLPCRQHEYDELEHAQLFSALSIILKYDDWWSCNTGTAKSGEQTITMEISEGWEWVYTAGGLVTVTCVARGPAEQWGCCMVKDREESGTLMLLIWRCWLQEIKVSLS